MDETYIESDPECDDTYHEGMCKGDLISRNQAQAKLKEICERFNYFYDDRYGEGTSGYAFVHAFDDAPSADVRPNIHGHWERMSDLPEDKDDRYKCSQCGNVVHHSNGVNLYHFNSWCGRCGSLNNSLIAGLEPKGEKGET